ncbi:hypothetical protein [Desulfoferrobacter suflitae]|nr:hypothetical protein [Desulfoferrobacter suflitae]
MDPVDYHSSIHSETGETPKDRYHTGLSVIRHVEWTRCSLPF